jgi:signal peptide peptidase SppA
MTRTLDLGTGKVTNDYAHIATKIRESIWLITPEGLDVVLSIANKRLNGEQFTDEYLEQIRSNGHSDEESELQVIKGLGILPIMGPIFGKANLMTQLSGATSLEVLQGQFREMLNNDEIHSILLNIDSPGGTSDLVQEMGDEIFAARDKKPVYAIANTGAGSAAYWLMSQATKGYITPSGSVGSIGAYTVHEDQSAADALEGIKYTFIHAGKFKTEGNPHEPLSDEGREFRQERINELHSGFVGAVARGRGTLSNNVESSYGQGRMLLPKQAVEAGMVDEIISMDGLVNRLTSNHKVGNSRGGENVNREQLLGFANSLNVSVLDTDSDDEIVAKCNMALAAQSAELEPLRNLKKETAQHRSFAEQFPEQAARMEMLEGVNRKTEAEKFSENYARCWTEQKETKDDNEVVTKILVQKGFSTLLKDKIADTHLAIVDSKATPEMFGEVLDLVASGNGIVDFQEKGSSRSSNSTGEVTRPETNGGGNNRDVFYSLTKEVAKRPENKDKDFTEILAITANEYPDEFEAYQTPMVVRNGG